MDRTPLPLAGIIAGAQAAVIGVAGVFAALVTVWLVASHGDDSALSVLRASGAVWLGTHMVPLTVGGSPLGLLPLLAVAWPVVLVRRAYRSAVRTCAPSDTYEYVLLAGFQTASYATVGVVVSSVMRSADLFASTPRAFFHTVVLAAVVTAAPQLPTLPEWARDSVRAGAASAAFLVAAGAVAVTVSLVLRHSQVAALTGAMAGGTVSGLALTLLCAGYVPNAAAWGMAYLLGPGIIVGAGHQASLFDVSLGRVPAFPLLAALPPDAPTVGRVLVVLPVVAAILLYAFTPRTTRAAAVAVATFTTVVTALAWLSSGALGSDQLAHVGPVPTDIAVAALRVVGGTVAALIVVPRLLLMLLRSRQS